MAGVYHHFRLSFFSPSALIIVSRETIRQWSKIGPNYARKLSDERGDRVKSHINTR